MVNERGDVDRQLTVHGGPETPARIQASPTFLEVGASRYVLSWGVTGSLTWEIVG